MYTYIDIHMCIYIYVFFHTLYLQTCDQKVTSMERPRLMYLLGRFCCCLERNRCYLRTRGHLGGNKGWVPKMVVPGTPNGRFTMEHSLKIDDLGVPLFQETSIYPTVICYIVMV